MFMRFIWSSVIFMVLVALYGVLAIIIAYNSLKIFGYLPRPAGAEACASNGTLGINEWVGLGAVMAALLAAFHTMRSNTARWVVGEKASDDQNEDEVCM